MRPMCQHFPFSSPRAPPISIWNLSRIITITFMPRAAPAPARPRTGRRSAGRGSGAAPSGSAARAPAPERDILDLHAGNVADHLLNVRNFDGNILDLNLRDFHLLVNSLDLDAHHLTNDLLHLDLRDVADHFLDLRDLNDHVLDLHLRHLNHALDA